MRALLIGVVMARPMISYQRQNSLLSFIKRNANKNLFKGNHSTIAIGNINTHIIGSRYWCQMSICVADKAIIKSFLTLAKTVILTSLLTSTSKRVKAGAIL